MEIDWKRFAGMQEAKRFPHAILLFGGDAKEVSDRLCKTLLCDHPNSDFSPCGECSACVWTRAGNHPEHIMVGTEEEHPIRVDDIRAIIERTHLAMSSRRCIEIRAADKMNVAAANALLKLLEEPHASTYLVLSTSSLTHIPATIRSRCQKIRVPTKPSKGPFEPPKEEAFQEALGLLLQEGGKGIPRFLERWSREPSLDLLDVWIRLIHRAVRDPDANPLISGQFFKKSFADPMINPLLSFQEELVEFRRRLGFFHYNAMLLLSVIAGRWIEDFSIKE